MLRAILNKSWRQHPQDTNCTATCLLSRKLFKLDEPHMQDTAGEAGRTHKWCTLMDPHTWPCKSRTTSTNIHSATKMRIRDAVQTTCQRRWTVGKSGERGSGISVLTARHDDDDDDIHKKNKKEKRNYLFDESRSFQHSSTFSV